jgi:hypothetical protein
MIAGENRAQPGLSSASAPQIKSRSFRRDFFRHLRFVRSSRGSRGLREIDGGIMPKMDKRGVNKLRSTLLDPASFQYSAPGKLSSIKYPPSNLPLTIASARHRA